MYVRPTEAIVKDVQKYAVDDPLLNTVLSRCLDKHIVGIRQDESLFHRDEDERLTAEEQAEARAELVHAKNRVWTDPRPPAPSTGSPNKLPPVHRTKPTSSLPGPNTSSQSSGSSQQTGHHRQGVPPIPSSPLVAPVQLPFVTSVGLIQSEEDEDSAIQ